MFYPEKFMNPEELSNMQPHIVIWDFTGNTVTINYHSLVFSKYISTEINFINQRLTHNLNCKQWNTLDP